MIILKWIWEGFGLGAVPPTVVFYTLRVLMFMLTFVLEDGALLELLPVPRQRRLGVMLVASSYVTWTWQTHTFSNSLETVLVLWCLVLIQRIKEDEVLSLALILVPSVLMTVKGLFSHTSMHCSGISQRSWYL